MAWVYLGIAGLLEIVWAVGMRYSEGFSRMGPSALTVIAMILSFGFLSLALKALPLGTAYAIWTGIGTVGTVAFGMLVLKEPATAMRFLFLVMILAGMVGLKMTSGAPTAQD